MDPRIHGSMDPQTLGSMDLWIPGRGTPHFDEAEHGTSWSVNLGQAKEVRKRERARAGRQCLGSRARARDGPGPGSGQGPGWLARPGPGSLGLGWPGMARDGLGQGSGQGPGWPGPDLARARDGPRRRARSGQGPGWPGPGPGSEDFEDLHGLARPGLCRDPGQDPGLGPAGPRAGRQCLGWQKVHLGRPTPALRR